LIERCLLWGFCNTLWCRNKNNTPSEAKSKLNLGNDVIHIRIVVLYAFETSVVTDWGWFIMACCGKYLVLRERGSNRKVEKFA